MDQIHAALSAVVFLAEHTCTQSQSCSAAPSATVPQSRLSLHNWKQQYKYSTLYMAEQHYSSTLKSYESIYAVGMRCRSGSGDGKIRKHRKYKCLIPFMWCISGTACGGIADFFPHHEVICAAAARPQKKAGVVCLSANFSFSIFGLLSTATEVSKSWQLWWRTIMKNWTQVAWGCDRHQVQTFVLWYCATKSVAFFWIFSSIFPPIGEV